MMRTRSAQPLLILLAPGFWLLAFPALAQPTQNEVFRSIGENIDNQTGDPTRALALLVAAVGLALLLVVLSHRRKRVVAPMALNHHGKLLKEIARNAGLKPAEIRRLKLLAEKESLVSPLTPLICPSMISGGPDRNTRSGTESGSD